ncbi:MAG TPA: exodeoxyribonuclease VII large subunit [Acidimicrobiales bacterium]
MSPAPEPDGSTWKVAELASHLGRLLGTALPDDLWIEGQIRDLSRAPSGHVYFQLTEPTAAGAPPTAQLAVVLLAAEKRHVNELLRRAGGAVRMEDGIEVRISGRVRWWAPRGLVQLRMSSIDPAFTLGRLAADRERTRAILAAEGLLEANGRLALAPVPLRVGLVTSVGSAAHADFLAHLAASGYAFEVHEADSRMQGPDAEAAVIAALHRLARRGIDVIAVVRGGGARTDLAAFDTEGIARSIAAMPVPVITGIGHEIDRSIADEVAHTSCKTPTSAADVLVTRVDRFLARADELDTAARSAGRRRVESAAARLDAHRQRLGRTAARALDRREAALVALPLRLQRAGLRSTTDERARLDSLTEQLTVRTGRSLSRLDERLASAAARANAHDPVRSMRRGWSITRHADGRIVRSVVDVPAGTAVRIDLADGSAVAEVEHVIPRDPPSPEPEDQT